MRSRARIGVVSVTKLANGPSDSDSMRAIAVSGHGLADELGDVVVTEQRRSRPVRVEDDALP
jgi:hypothetical protein